MTASATTTRATTQSYYLPSTTLKTIDIKLLPRSVTFLDARKRPRRLTFTIKSSGSEASAEATASQTSDSEAPVEVPEGPPSLISALNVEKALRGIAITDADHYGRLGLRRGCSYGQVLVAYKNKIEQLMNQGLEEEESTKNLELLKESYSILSSAEERRLYDWSLVRNEKPDAYMWPFEVDITQTPTGVPPPQEAEDEGPTRLVGYFIFGWLVLSFALLIVLNR